MSPSNASYRQVQRDAARRLAGLPQAAAELEAALLLCHLLGVDRTHLFAWPDKRLSAAQLADYEALIQRRLQGEPIAHITGEREFWSLPLRISRDTLIPRPETELLVERALTHLDGCASPRVADLGTGSGAIALALASELPDAEIHACDHSAAALAMAQENAARLRLANLAFFAGDWCQALPTDATYDLIVSNPPYIAAADPHLRQGDLPREPQSALVSGIDGLDDIRSIAAQAPPRLRPGGWLLLEHGQEQGSDAREILHHQGFIDIITLRDLADRPRLTEGRKPPTPRDSPS